MASVITPLLICTKVTNGFQCFHAAFWTRNRCQKMQHGPQETQWRYAECLQQSNQRQELMDVHAAVIFAVIRPALHNATIE